MAKGIFGRSIKSISFSGSAGPTCRIPTLTGDNTIIGIKCKSANYYVVPIYYPTTNYWVALVLDSPGLGANVKAVSNSVNVTLQVMYI